MESTKKALIKLYFVYHNKLKQIFGVVFPRMCFFLNNIENSLKNILHLSGLMMIIDQSGMLHIS